VLLLIDDDPLISESLELVLKDEYEVRIAATRAEARDRLLALDRPPDLALVDLGLPPAIHRPDEGFALIGELLAFNAAIKILVLSGQSDKANIKHALTLGAVDFIPKPCDTDLLRARLHHQLLILEAERGTGPVEAGECGLIGSSSAMQMLRDQIAQFADNPFPVLIEGESGSGKEVVAQCLHRQSSRTAAPFLTINCAAFTPELLEAQLFGHTKGAFTGANKASPGFFEDAGRGTLFLDEIGDMPLPLQSKLLRVLENGEFYRIGETRPRIAEARILAATNRDLREEIQAGGFRADLYHRLSVLDIHVPALRECSEDVMALLEHFLSMYADSVRPFRLDPQAQELFVHYPFFGNVRELRNIVIRLAARYPGQTVGLEQLRADLEPEIGTSRQPGHDGGDERVRSRLTDGTFDLDTALAGMEQQYIDAALDISGGNLSQAARLLGVNRTTLHSRIQKLSMKKH